MNTKADEVVELTPEQQVKIDARLDSDDAFSISEAQAKVRAAEDNLKGLEIQAGLYRTDIAYWLKVIDERQQRQATRAGEKIQAINDRIEAGVKP